MPVEYNDEEVYFKLKAALTVAREAWTDSKCPPISFVSDEMGKIALAKLAIKVFDVLEAKTKSN